MPVSLQKGAHAPINSGEVVVAMGWDINPLAEKEPGVDLDASAFLLGEDGKVRNDGDFIFYNQMVSEDGSVKHKGDDFDLEKGREDDEEIQLSLSKLPERIRSVAFVATIHEATERGQSLSLISNGYIRILDAASKQEIARYDIRDGFETEDAVFLGEIMREGEGWSFRAVGEGRSGGLVGMCNSFGVEVG